MYSSHLLIVNKHISLRLMTYKKFGLPLGEVLAAVFEYKTQKHTMGVEKYLENSETTACVNSQLICGLPSLFTSSRLMAEVQCGPCGLLYRKYWKVSSPRTKWAKKQNKTMSKAISRQIEVEENHLYKEQGIISLNVKKRIAITRQ